MRSSEIIILDPLPAISTGRIRKRKLAQSVRGKAAPAQVEQLASQQIQLDRENTLAKEKRNRGRDRRRRLHRR
jgi:hypothetical protein